MINLQAKLEYPPIKLPYTYVPYFDPYESADNEWENKCYREANSWIQDLFDIDGFTDFFVENHCCVSIENVKIFVESKGIDSQVLEFIHAQEFSHVTMNFNDRVLANTGSVYVEWRDGGLLRDLRYRPAIKVNIDGVDVYPYEEKNRNGYVCYDYDLEDLCKCEIAFHICYAAKRIIPGLYALRDEMGSDWMCEKGESLDMDYPAVDRVVDYCIDEDITPVYDIAYPEDSDEGRARDHESFVLFRPADLAEKLRKHKDEIKRIFNS